jgi:hypothetical protein
VRDDAARQIDSMRACACAVWGCATAHWGRQAARTASEGAALTADAASIVFFSARVSIELSTSLLTEVRVYV